MGFKLADKQKVSIAIVISFAFFVSEIVVAFKTGSLALMADAFHYLNDLVGFIVTLMSIIISEKTEFRQDFSFGWQRARLLGAFFNGAFLLALGISIFLQSVERFISLKEVSEVKLILIMGCVGLGLNIITAAFLHEHHHHHHDHGHGHSATPDSETSSGAEYYSPICPHDDHAQSECRAKQPSKGADFHADHRHVQQSLKPPGRDLGMMGAMLHVIGDALNNVGVIIAAVVIWFTSSPARFYADPAVGMGISIMILFSAMPLVKHSGEILLQSAPQGVNLSDIKHDIEKIPGIASVHELHVWRLDQKKAIATAHIVVSDPDVASFMAKAKTIRECLHAYGIHSTTVQPELLLGAPPPPPSTRGSAAAASQQESEGVEPVDAGQATEMVAVSAAAAAAAAPSGPCQISCGKGMCDHLMCCNTLVQL
ncbi:hypothetical protein C8A05DRAFT_29213 [Staphylotrichum tortipilum]|uniref:Cation efflux protein n=1 Tax=Staphylotrichum tortipilum TaxID=2831512 RepID=A0AAN6MVA5_9PEZI|nr:hypothetical protein C8A05DRAFT_29213 [Staphylotrichum longicolle]